MHPEPYGVDYLQSGSDEKLLEIADKLAQQGWAIVPNFIPPEVVDGLREDIEQLARHAQLRPAAVGRGLTRQVETLIRSDRISWISEQTAGPSAQSAFVARMNALRQVLNEQLFLGLMEFECHFAHYPPGAFYSKHLDQHTDLDSRRVSAVTYLNSQWTPEDGGELRIYFDDNSSIDVPPVAGTLVTFLSDRFYHEVLPTRSSRYSLAGWFRRRPLGTAL